MMNDTKKRVAAIVTEYRRRSHADVIVGKILEGYNQDGGPGPNLKLVSMYVDQLPATDMSRELARKHGFTIYETIADALTLGSKQLAVDGVEGEGRPIERALGRLPRWQAGLSDQDRPLLGEELVGAGRRRGWLLGVTQVGAPQVVHQSSIRQQYLSAKFEDTAVPAQARAHRPSAEPNQILHKCRLLQIASRLPRKIEI